MDLIVGPFYGKSFAKFASFAKTFGIPIINPLSTREEIIFNNPYVFKVKPDVKNQLDIITAYLIENYPRSNIVLVRGNNYKYKSEVSYIRNMLNKSRQSHVYLPNNTIAETIIEQSETGRLLTENKLLKLDDFSNNLLDSSYFSNLVKEMVYHSDSLSKLSYNLSKVRNNVVVALGDNIVYVKDLTSQLNKLSLDHDITLVGMPEWIDYNEIETQQKLNLKLHCFTSFLVDYSDPDIQLWVNNFRKKYNSEPTFDNYAFDGFDLGWYFLNALYQVGPEFPKCLKYLKLDLIHTKYNFESDGNSGYQNTFWDLGKYQNFQFQQLKTYNRKTNFTDYMRY